MTEQAKQHLALEYHNFLAAADKERNRGNLRVADSYEESAAKIETKFQADDSDIEDYTE